MLLVLILGTPPALAEFFKYVDENGVARYTDDLTQVPVNQRPGVHTYIESHSDAGDMADKGQKATEKVDTPHTASKQGQEAQGDIDEIRTQLKNKKQELDQEYKAILEEQKKVVADKKNSKTYSDTMANNAEIIKFNEKLKKFEEKQKAFNQEVKSFNARLKQALNEKPEKTVSGKILKK